MNFLQFDWFTLVIIYVVFSSVSSILQKTVIKRENVHPSAFIVFFQLIAGIIILPVAIMENHTFPENKYVWLLALASTSFYVGAVLLYFNALKSVEISQANIITSIRSIWFLFIGIIFFNEAFNLNKLIGIILIVVGISIVYIRKSEFGEFGKSHVMIILYTLLYSVAASLDKHILNYFSPATYVFISFTLTAILTTIFVPGIVSKLKPLLKLDKQNLLIVLCSSLTSLAGLAAFSAYKLGAEISKVGPIMQATIVLTVAFGIIFLKERKGALKKVIGAAIVCLGVILIKLV